jgi:hypothetical protein
MIKNIKITQIEIPSRPLAMHDISYDAGVMTDKNEDEDWHGAEVRVRIHHTELDEHSRAILDEQIRAKYAGAASIIIEHITAPMERVRSAEIAAATSLRDKMQEWGNTNTITISPEALTYADRTESECVI